MGDYNPFQQYFYATTPVTIKMGIFQRITLDNQHLTIYNLGRSRQYAWNDVSRFQGMGGSSRDFWGICFNVRHPGHWRFLHKACYRYDTSITALSWTSKQFFGLAELLNYWRDRLVDFSTMYKG